MITSKDTSGAAAALAAPVLVTGVAGFIGFHVARRLLANGTRVVGIDNLNEYYDVSLKQARLDILMQIPGFEFSRLDLVEGSRLENLMKDHGIKLVINLAAQAGVRYSFQDPQAYTQSNLVGFQNILEACRRTAVDHLVYASSSSIYGANTRLPFAETDKTDQPISFYGATKKANELMAHAYSHLYGFPCTGLRFFTVYGPWGRPDMALFKFTKAILAGQAIDLYNYGKMQRDFTYIDDIVEGVLKVLWHRSRGNPARTDDRSEVHTPHRVYNLGNHSPVSLDSFIMVLEKALGSKAILNLLPMQDGEILATYADISRLQSEIGFVPTWSFEVGIREFVSWYRAYHRS